MTESRNSKRPANQKLKKQKQLWIIAPLILIFLFVCLITVRSIKKKALQKTDTSNKTESLVPVKIIKAKPGNISKFIKYSGVIHARQQARILSEVSGKVKSINAKVGDPLEPGDPILKIDDEVLKYTVEQAEANVLRLEAAHDVSKKDLTRKKNLFEKNVISEFEFDAAKANEKTNRALLNSAKASLKIAKRELRETLIKSPFKGILAERTVDIGSNVGQGTMIATVVAIDKVKIKIGVSEQVIARLKQNQEVIVETDAYPGKKYKGVIDSVGTKADDKTLSFPAEIMINNDKEPILKPGMVARTTINTDNFSNVISLPEEAIYENNGAYYAWIIKNNTAHKVKVIPSSFIGTNVVIKKGIKPNQTVVVSGRERLLEGSPVQIIAKP
jgi:membrane fusion protein (multidrug efflux system)